MLLVGVLYYLRSLKDYQWLVYPPRLTVELGSYVDGEPMGGLGSHMVALTQLHVLEI